MCKNFKVKLKYMSDKTGNQRINKQTASVVEVIFPKLWLVPPAVYRCLKQYTRISPSATRQQTHVYYYTRTKALGKEWQTIVGF